MFYNSRYDAYLNSYFWQANLISKFFSTVNIRIVWFIEGSFKLVKLERCESCSVSSVFLWVKTYIIIVIRQICDVICVNVKQRNMVDVDKMGTDKQS